MKLRTDSAFRPSPCSRIARAAPDVIVANGPTAALELKKTGTKLPVVFVVVFDPVKLGLAEGLARPGGSFTGLSTAVPEGFFGKQLTLLREALPEARRATRLISRGSRSRSRAAKADATPSGPSKAPPSGTESRCGGGLACGGDLVGERIFLKIDRSELELFRTERSDERGHCRGALKAVREAKDGDLFRAIERQGARVPVEIEPVLIAGNPGMHIENVRPADHSAELLATLGAA